MSKSLLWEKRGILFQHDLIFYNLSTVYGLGDSLAASHTYKHPEGDVYIEALSFTILTDVTSAIIGSLLKNSFLFPYLLLNESTH